MAPIEAPPAPGAAVVPSTSMSWDQSYPLGAVLSRKHLPSLDGLRMIAVLLVILYHAGWEGVPSDLGVSGFFVLSGFLITWLLIKERDQTGTIGLGTFYMRRAFRLLPAYYAYLAVAFVLYFRHPGARTDIIAPSLFYYANYFNATHDHPATPISHTWSLAVEEQFYLLWPLAFLLLSRVSRRAMATILTAAIVLVLAWRSYVFLHLSGGTAWVYNAFDCRFDTLAVGCLAAVLSKEALFLRLARGAARHAALPLVPIGLLFLTHYQHPIVYKYTVGFTIDALLIGLAIVQIVQLAERPAWRWLDHRVPRYLGSISYPIYLWHGFAMSPVRRLEGAPIAVKMIAYALIAVALGMASYHGIEKPFLRLRARLTAKKQKQEQEQAAAA